MGKLPDFFHFRNFFPTVLYNTCKISKVLEIAILSIHMKTIFFFIFFHPNPCRVYLGTAAPQEGSALVIQLPPIGSPLSFRKF